MYERNCPVCNNIVTHTKKHNRDYALNEKRLCVSCSRRKYEPTFYENKYRRCPECGEKIHYFQFSDKIKAHEANSLCKKCMVNSGKYKEGHAAPNKIPVFDCWVQKYGEEEANRLDQIRKKKWSKSFSGKNNPMYGVPSPKGSGNGWSGWYKDWYFRSLLEISYMIKVIERYNLKWSSAETKNLTIPYIDYKGNNRTYRADFLINNKYLVDCKPKKLQSSVNNLLKKEAAINFCNKKGLIFKFSEIPKLTKHEFKKLINNNQVKLLKRYEKRYRKEYEVSERQDS